MTDFLLELRSEEIPARMQEKARADLERLFVDALASAGLAAAGITTYATPRRLALIAHGLPLETEAVSEETKGPRASAPPQAREGFLRKTGLTREQLVERDGVLFAIVDKPGRATADVLIQSIPNIVRAFPWPKAMRWGAPSLSTESPRWVRPLQGVVAILGEDVLEFEVAGVASSAATVGHRFHHPGAITIGGAFDYVEKLRACHVIVDGAERRRIIADGAAAAARAAGLTLIEDEGLLFENAGLTEYPVPLLGRFDEAFLDVPPEVIQLTARVNQKYFVCAGPDGTLANAFVCTANIDAADGGARIVEGNRKVLAARLSDARFFYETDLKTPLAEQAKKLEKIVFHEKLGTVADKVDRVARLARWLVEEGIVKPGRSAPSLPLVPSEVEGRSAGARPWERASTSLGTNGGDEAEDRANLANLAEQAARLCKADLVTGMVGEFPELQGLIGGYYARAEGLDPQIAEAIRDHYKPVGQGDEVPTAPVTVAVSLADKLDTLVSFACVGDMPTGSRDPYAIRRSMLAILSLIGTNDLALSLTSAAEQAFNSLRPQRFRAILKTSSLIEQLPDITVETFQARWDDVLFGEVIGDNPRGYIRLNGDEFGPFDWQAVVSLDQQFAPWYREINTTLASDILVFATDRLKVQQREAGVRHDLIDAVFALGGEDDLVRLLARVRALQAFVATDDGANLLAGYKRAANILKKEGVDAPAPSASTPAQAGVHDEAGADGEMDPGLRRGGNEDGTPNPLSYTPEKEEADLLAALDAAEEQAGAAVAREDFEGAMAALAGLRAPIDAFFDKVTVNDPVPAKRDARLAMLARVRAAVHRVADFSRIEG